MYCCSVLLDTLFTKYELNDVVVWLWPAGWKITPFWHSILRFTFGKSNIHVYHWAQKYVQKWYCAWHFIRPI